MTRDISVILLRYLYVSDPLRFPRGGDHGSVIDDLAPVDILLRGHLSAEGPEVCIADGKVKRLSGNPVSSSPMPVWPAVCWEQCRWHR